MGTFGSFTTVRLGIYSAQKGLDVTGNNITNINTEGYTRQRLNQVSLIPSAVDRYSSTYNTRIGQGAIVAGVTQLRDPGLDILYRRSNADVGSANAKLDGLNSLANILDEVGKGSLDQDDGVILSQLNDIRDLISKAIASGGSSTYNDLIRSSADALVTHFNSYADKLAQLQDTYETKLNQQITEINDKLTQIRNLNLSIRDADLRGDPALELRDDRNRLLDELSEYMDIDVKYTMEDVGAGTMVEKLTVTLASDVGHDNHVLVDGLYATTLSQGNEANGYQISISNLLDDKGNEDPNFKNNGTDLVEGDLYGSLQSVREILIGKGEYATTRDSLDTALKDGVTAVNDILDNIQKLNTTIYGGTASPAEITKAQEDRKQLLDQLNNYVGITVTPNGSPETSISITLKNGSATLLDSANNTLNKFSVDTVADGNPITVGTTPLTANDFSGTLKELQDAANGKADTELNSDVTSIRGIPYYRMALDNLAYEFATEMNKLNNTGLEGSGNLFSIGSDTNDVSGVDANGKPVRITASNISVSKGWDNQSISIQTTDDPYAPSGDTSQLSKFLDLFSKNLDFDPGDVNIGANGDPFHGTFEDMLLKIQSTLGEDQMSTDSILNNYTVTLGDLYVDRQGVTGVDLNDEAANLMVYQKAYTAACRLMTTLNEALDSLINGTL